MLSRNTLVAPLIGCWHFMCRPALTLRFRFDLYEAKNNHTRRLLAYRRYPQDSLVQER